MSCISVGWGAGEVGQWLQMTGILANTYDMIIATS